MAMDAGPAAAPIAAPKTRNTINDVASHASDVNSAKTPAPRTPTRYRRRWPHTSPALPNAGPTTPNASSGPVMTHVRVASLASRSPAMVGMETASRVMVKLTANSPDSTVARTSSGYRELPATRAT
jgi:hypothetical protein